MSSMMTIENLKVLNLSRCFISMNITAWVDGFYVYVRHFKWMQSHQESERERACRLLEFRSAHIHIVTHSKILIIDFNRRALDVCTRRYVKKVNARCVCNTLCMESSNFAKIHLHIVNTETLEASITKDSSHNLQFDVIEIKFVRFCYSSRRFSHQ